MPPGRGHGQDRDFCEENDEISFSTKPCKCDEPNDVVEEACGKGAEGEDTQVAVLPTTLTEKCSTNVTELNLSGQGLSSLPEDDYTHLLVLNLSKNKLTELPQKLKTATCLRVVNVSHNKLSGCPPILLDSMRMVKTLNLSFNSIISLPVPACAQHLTELSARSCNIEDFPEWVLYQLHAIESLDLSANPIFEIFAVDEHRPPHSSVRLLKRLNVANTYLADHKLNRLCRFFRSLEFLDVSNHGPKYSNRIVKCAENLPPNLKVIKASNAMMAFSPKFSGMRIEKVNLSENPLSWLKEDFPASSVKMLVLHDCFLCSLPDNFGDMINLEYLNISNNDVGELPSSFASLLKLRHLDLYNNSLSSFPKVLAGLEKLHCLDCCQNYFDPPDHPTGTDLPSYAELRKALRSSLPSARKCGPRLNPYDNYGDDQNEASSMSHSRSSLSADSDVDENEPVVKDNVAVFDSRRQDEEEDWGAMDENEIYSDFPAPSVARDEFNSDPNLNIFYRPFLRYVPDRIKNSPMYFHRIDTRVLPPPKDVMSEVFNPGQFDDA